jgi:hypothetical protein
MRIIQLEPLLRHVLGFTGSEARQDRSKTPNALSRERCAVRAGKGGHIAHLDGVYEPADGLGRRGTLAAADHPLVTVLCMVMVLVATCCRVVAFPRFRLPRSVGLLAAGAWGVKVKTTEPAQRVCSTRRRRVHTATGASPRLLLPRKFTFVAFALDRDGARPPTMANGAVWGH